MTNGWPATDGDDSPCEAQSMPLRSCKIAAVHASDGKAASHSVRCSDHVQARRSRDGFICPEDELEVWGRDLVEPEDVGRAVVWARYKDGAVEALDYSCEWVDNDDLDGQVGNWLFSFACYGLRRVE